MSIHIKVLWRRQFVSWLRKPWLMALSQGDTEGFVRFDTAESAQTALAKAGADGKVELVDGDDKRAAGIALITGDEEQALVNKVQSGCPPVHGRHLLQYGRYPAGNTDFCGH